jgi:DNA-binding NarL/FixJ family response regulator
MHRENRLQLQRFSPETGGSSVQIRILVADDYPAVRRGVRAVLESQAGWSVVAEAENGQEALQRARDHTPDVAVIDISMPLMNGLELARQLRTVLPQTEILILTQHTSRGMLEQALKAGARGYLVKSAVASELIPAVEAVMQHQAFVSSDIET